MDTTRNEQLHQLDQTYYMPTFKRFPQALVRGEGCHVWDADGRRYLDLLAGIAVNNVGHCHPRVVRAIQDQAATLTHISNFFVSEPQVNLSRRLVELSGLDRVFLTNSGAESLEGAIKIARKYAHSVGRGGDVISFHQAFHGRTLATIATGKPAMQKGFGPIPQGFHRVPFGDLDAVRAATSDETAAIVIEPIQGEGGIHVADRDFLHALRAFCTEHRIALIFDEVQCGVGRTGRWFAKDLFGVDPDIMTLAKGLGGGVPIGAILSNQTVSNAIDFGDHGTTFGGNPLVCAAALATLDVIEEEGLLEQTRETGAWFRDQVRALDHSVIIDVRGEGLMTGIELDREAKPIVLDLLDQGIIANATAGSVVRIVPPLIVTRDQLTTFLTAFEQALNTAHAH